MYRIREAHVNPKKQKPLFDVKLNIEGKYEGGGKVIGTVRLERRAAQPEAVSVIVGG